MKPLMLIGLVLIITGMAVAFAGITSSTEVCSCPTYPAPCPCAGQSLTSWTFTPGFYAGVVTALMGGVLLGYSVLYKPVTASSPTQPKPPGRSH